MCNGAKRPGASHIKLAAILDFFIFKFCLKDNSFHSFKQIPAPIPSDHRQRVSFSNDDRGKPLYLLSMEVVWFMCSPTHLPPASIWPLALLLQCGCTRLAGPGASPKGRVTRA